MYWYKFKVYRYKSLKSAQNVCFSPIFPYFDTQSTLHFKHTSKPFQIPLESLFYSISLSILILIQRPRMNYFKNHSNMGYDPYTNQAPRFVRVCSKPYLNFLTFNHESNNKGGFHTILFLVGLTNLNFKKSKVRMQFYQNPSFWRQAINHIKPLKFHRFILRFSFHTKIQSSIP